MIDRCELIAGCRVWLVDLTASDDGEYARAYELLSQGERACATSMRSEVARRRFVLTRGAVRVRLGSVLGVAPERVALRIGEHGKPELAPEQVASLDGERCAPGQVASLDGECLKPSLANLLLSAGIGSARVTRNPPRFNLAHGDGVALLAVHPRQDVGVDVERIAPAGERPWRRLLERICHPSEVAEATAEARRLGPRAFYERWVGKEAVLKALGPGLRISPAAVSLRRDRAGALRVRELPSPWGFGADGAALGGGEGAGPVGCTLLAARTPQGFVGAVALVDRGAVGIEPRA
jgi:4'-phosphopantetheinyl transferase